MANPYQGLQDFVAQLPEIVQPLVVAGLGMIPYVEGEGSAALGILVGIHPVVAAVAGATGNILSVLAVVLLSARVREHLAARRARRARREAAAAAREPVLVGPGVRIDDPGVPEAAAAEKSGTQPKPTRGEKGRRRLSRWLVRFGVPGASLLAPLALPTQLTAAFLVASGIKKGWVILWQVIAIVLWTSLVAVAALGLITALGW